MSGNNTLMKVLRFIRRYTLLVIISILLAAVSVVLTLYIPILFGEMIDHIISEGNVNMSAVGEQASLILKLILLTSAATWIMNLINNRISFQTVRDIRAIAIRRLQGLPLSYLDSRKTGDIVSAVIADVDQLSDGLLLGFTQLFTGVITILVTLYFMFRKSVPISLLVLVLTPLSLLAARYIASRSYAMFRKQSETRGKQTALIEEMIGNEKIVKAFGYEQTASERFSEINKDLQNYSQKAVFFSSITNPTTRFVNSVTYAAVACLGAFLILKGNLTVGGLTVMLSYANQYMKPFNDISSVITELQNALACASRVFAFIEEKQEIPEKPAEMAEAEGNIRIDDVSFSYDKNSSLIENFNLTAGKGMHIALVGPTGCGKTTFINLLMRFYDVDDGSISVDDTDIRDVTRHSLRKNYGMVLQDTWLKNDTVRANIAFGRPDASDEEIIKAAKEAHSWEFIRRMPQGLDTVISDDSLSQGQKQLLCITRVMLCLPPMLILDEATSSIDTRTELQIQEAFDKLMAGRTSFVVAHRLSTIRNADIILVMKDGKIIEQGNHAGLMKQNGFYRHLYESQFALIENHA